MYQSPEDYDTAIERIYAPENFVDADECEAYYLNQEKDENR